MGILKDFTSLVLHFREAEKERLKAEKEALENLPETFRAELEEMASVKQIADGLVEEVNTSLMAACESGEIKTRNLQLSIARGKLLEAKRLSVHHTFLHLKNLEEVELQILQVEQDTKTLEYRSIANDNLDGHQLEKKGMIKEAAEAYERLVSKMVDTPFVYRRLAILYRKLKSLDDEVRVLREALKNIPKSKSKTLRVVQGKASQGPKKIQKRRLDPT